MDDYIRHCKDCRNFSAGDCVAPEIESFAKLVSGLKDPNTLPRTAFEMRMSENGCGLFAHWFEPKGDDD